MAKTTKKKTSKRKTASASRKKTTKASKGRSPGASATPGSKPASTSGKHLVIVESPTKAKTINKYLGSNYVVMASVGHVRDLPSRAPKGVKQLVPGVDLENDFEPTYEVLPKKKKTVTDLKRAAKNADDVWFATDLDREGEAIAWHLAQALGVDTSSAKRVVFNAITKKEIQNAFDHPKSIDSAMVNAQQARRILDRIVGYQVSPLLWKKVAGGLSAGRVQSVATRLIVEREREIDAFVPDEFWRIVGCFSTDITNGDSIRSAWHKWIEQQKAAALEDGKAKRNGNGRGSIPTLKQRNAWLADHSAFPAELTKVDGKDFNATDAEQALAAAEAAGYVMLERIDTEDPKGKGPAKNRVQLVGKINPTAAKWSIDSIQTKRTKSRPPAPFITSTIQQAAANQLSFPATMTMRTAQQLYEGVDIKGVGQVGLITYMRTDSTHLSGEALTMAREFIDANYGDKYLPEKPNFYSSSNKAAQEAHEAIRPTDVTLTPDDPRVKKALSDVQLKLYRLIWKQFVACQMVPAQWDATTLLINGENKGHNVTFKATGRILIFDGFYRAMGRPQSADDPELPKLEEKQEVTPVDAQTSQHFTSPPPRFTEASLVKKLESEGIGRPSTYAAIISVIQNRKYVEKISGRFHATDLGMVVTTKLIEGFPTIMDIGYTRDMESELDKVEEEHHDWVKMLHEFYKPFSKNLEKAHESMVHAKAETEPAPYKCEKCGADTMYRFGKNGRFLSCTQYPECKYAAPIDREGKPMQEQLTDIACLICGKGMTKRTGRFGPFLGCVDYPTCKGIINIDKKTGGVKLPKPPPLQIDLNCAKCDSPLNMRRSKRGPWLSCSAFPKCRGRMAWSAIEEDKQKALEIALMQHEKDNPVPPVKKMDTTLVEEGYRPIIAGEDAEDDADE